MSSINKVILLGNVGSVEVKEYEKNGTTHALVQVSLATNESYKAKDGEWKDKTEWHKCIFAIPSLAERAKAIGKGDTIYVEGSINTNKWTDKEGNDQYTKEIAVTSYRTHRKAQTEGKAQVEDPATSSAGDDDLPF